LQVAPDKEVDLKVPGRGATQALRRARGFAGGIAASASDLTASWTVIAAATLAQATEALTVQGFPSLVPFVAEELTLTKARTGMLTSAFFAGGLVSVIPAGWVIDRIGVRKSLTIALGLMSASVALAARAGSFWQLYICLFISGIGFGSVYPATTKAIMHWVQPRLRGTMMGIKQTGDPLGGAVAAIVLPVAAVASSWRGSLLLVAAACLASMVCCRFLYHTHPDELAAARDCESQTAGIAARARADREALLLALRTRDIWLINVSGLFFLGVQVTMVAWLVTYLRASLALPVIAAGSALSVLQLGGAAGRLGWGAVSDLLFRGRRRPVVILVGAMTAAALIGLSLLSTPSYPLVLLTCFAAGLAGMGWIGMVTVLRAELAPRGAVAVITSLGSFTGCAGSLLGPPLLGLLLDRTGDFQIGWRFLAVGAVVAAVFAAAVREPAGAAIIRETAGPDR
jgi:sugar phosphate permease